MSLQTQSDENLVRSAASGSKEAFNALVMRYQKMIYNMIMAKVKNEHTALDLTQETFLKSYRSINSCKTPALFSHWLGAIAKNNCLIYFRGQKKAVCLNENTADLQTEAPDFLKHGDDNNNTNNDERIKSLEKAISALSEDTQLMIKMRHFENKSFQEIADALKKPLSSVTSQLYRAYEKLQQDWFARFGKS